MSQIRRRPLIAMLALVVGMITLTSTLPAILSLRPVEGSVSPAGSITLITGGNLVPFVIAASFTRITDNENNLVLDVEGKDPGELTTREQVFTLIQESPGIWFREISRRLEKEIGVVQYHVYLLQKFGLVESIKDGRYTRYFVKSPLLTSLAKQVISAWQRPVEKTILVALLDSDIALVAKDLVALCGVTTQAISWHASRLRKNGLLVKETPNSELALEKAAKEKMAELLQLGVIQRQ